MSKTLLTVLITIWSCGVALQFLIYWALPAIVKFFVKTLFPEDIFKNAVEESYNEMKEEWDKEAWSFRDIFDILLWPVWLIYAGCTYLLKSKKKGMSNLKKVNLDDKQPCLALWVPCAWTNEDSFREDAKKFFGATGVVENWKWENGDTRALKYQTKSGSICSVEVQKWLVWNPNLKEFHEYYDSEFKTRFKDA